MQPCQHLQIDRLTPIRMNKKQQNFTTRQLLVSQITVIAIQYNSHSLGIILFMRDFEYIVVLLIFCCFFFWLNLLLLLIGFIVSNFVCRHYNKIIRFSCTLFLFLFSIIKYIHVYRYKFSDSKKNFYYTEKQFACFQFFFAIETVCL